MLSMLLICTNSLNCTVHSCETLRVCFPGVKLPVETTPVPCSIKWRWAGRCEHLTLASSLMGTHCVLTFKVPQYLAPCLSRCFPPSCYLAVKAGDLTADLKDCSSTEVLFNDPPTPFLSLFLSQVCLTVFFHLSSSLSPFQCHLSHFLLPLF